MRTEARVAVPSGALLLAALLAGCASLPASNAESAAGESDKRTASELYAGKPPVVHATQFPVASAAEGIQRGDDAWRAGKLDLAVYLYVQSLAFDAGAPEPFLKIASIHEQLGNRALAEKAFELALERQPDNAAACERLGRLYLQSERNEDARALFERAIALDAGRWRSHDGLGVLADRREDFGAAIGHYDRALALEPKAAPVMNNRGFSRFLAGDLARAEADLREAIRLGAGDGAWSNLGKVQASQTRYEVALESLLHAMDPAAAHNLIGETAMESGDYVAAQEHFTAAISASPRYYEAAHKNLALLKERLARQSERTTVLVRTDTQVQSDGAVIGTARKGQRVQVLATEAARSLISFQDLDRGQLVGWIPTMALMTLVHSIPN